MWFYVVTIGACTVEATKLKFSTELGLHLEKVRVIVQAGYPHSQGLGVLKMGSQGSHSPNGVFLGKLYKTRTPLI